MAQGTDYCTFSDCIEKFFYSISYHYTHKAYWSTLVTSEVLSDLVGSKFGI